MNKLFIIVFTTFVLSNSALADSPDALENIASIAAAPAVCGYKVNEKIINVAVSSLFTNPSDLNLGGRHYPKLQENLQQIKTLTATESGRDSFCARVSSELSAFFN
jgi:hypothetical protein